MNRLKLLGAIALLGVLACEEATPPPPVGSIAGQVAIEGTGIDGVSVNLSNGNSTTTSGGGNYRFDNVEGGAYTVTISGYPSDATFDATSAAATISSAGQSVTINFSGSYIRTASVMGSVTVENMGLGGVTVALSGVSTATAVTDDSGQYAFTGLRMGSYSVEISGFDSDEVGFSNTASAVTVGTGESKIVSFDGTYLRTAGIQGQVSVEGVGLEGVNVSLTGGPDGQDMTTTTDAAGLYSFAKLRAGDYAVGISGFDTNEYEFAVTSQNVTIALGETANLPFEGILLRTSGIAGRVSVGGMGIADVTVTISADGMDDVTAMTDASGQYAVSALAAGDYMVTISGYDAVEYMFEDSQSVTLAMDQTAIVNFEGTALRSASIAVSVTADDEGVAGAAVTLTQITGATSGTVLGTQETDADGNAAFGPLLAGAYRVDIEVDSDEIDFESTDATVTVATAEMGSVSFAGTINRTGSIAGSVTVDGTGMADVSVMLSGGGDMVADTMMTGDDGSYSFTGLRKGDYTVSIMNPDENRYEFASASESVSLAVGQSQSVSFAGSMTRSSSISGRVGLGDGTGVEGVAVMLSGAADDDAMTDAGGLYTFTGLGAGDYTVSIMLSDEQEAAYNFAEGETSKSVTLGDDDQQTVNFMGSHDMSASVTVKLFVDEATKNDMMDEGEMAFPTPHMLEMVAAAGLPLALPISLEGPGVGEMNPGTPMPDGSVVFGNLRAGTYQVSISDISAETLAGLAAVAPELAAALADYAYGGPPVSSIDVGVGAQEMHYGPVDITHQTVNFSVWLKDGDETGDALPGATVSLYADMDGEMKLGSGMTDDMGVTAIRIERAPTTGNMAYAGIEAPEGDYWVDPDADMQAVMWNPQYPMMPEVETNTADVVNLKAEVSFAGATVTTAMGGGDALAGWAIDVTMMDEDGEMVAVEGAPDMLDDDGMGMLMVMAESAADLPMTYYVNFDEDQEGEDADGNELDGGESYETVDAAMYTHTGLSVDTEMDAGTVTARYTTQTLIVSVYREVDQVPGFTGNIGTGDVSATCIAEDEDDECVTGVELELRHETPTNRRDTFDPEVWKWEARNVSSRTVWIDKGVYTFRGLPTDHNVFVLADEVGYVEIVPTDNLAAYEDKDANGIEGSAFGSEGGFGHTVMLCPGRAVDPTDQDHGECGSFGFVPTHTVAAHVKKMIVETDNDDGFRAERAINVTGVELGWTPVTGKNIAGEADAITTLKDPVRSAGETSSSSTWDDQVDERQDLYFGRMAEGVYGFSLSDKWSAVANGVVIGKEFRLDEDDVMDVTDLTGADGPFRPADEEGVYVEVRPTTGTLYGIVLDEADDPLEGVEVTVNGVTVETDIDGRYIVPDFSRGASSRGDRAVGAPAGTKLYVSFSLDGYDTQRDDPNNSRSSRRYQIADADGAKDGIDFEANDPQRLDIVLAESQMLATITGTVTDKDGDPVSGVDLTVVNEAGEDVLHNRQWISAIGAYCTVGEGDAAMNCRRTGDDGTYEMQVRVTDDDEDYTITPSKNRYYFDNTDETERLEAGDDEDGVDFEALRQSRIRGAVKDADDNGMGGVTVTATARDRTPVYAPSDETNDNGRFTIWVDGDERYDVRATKDGYSFGDTEDEDNLGLRVDDDETHDIGTFTATAVPSDVSTLSGLTVSPGVLDPATFDPMTTTYAAKVGYNVTSTRVEATATSSAATVTITAGDNEEMGTGSASIDVELDEGSNTVTIAVESEDESTTTTYTLTVTRSGDQPSAVRNLEAASTATQSLTLTWGTPQNLAGLTGYEYSVNSTDGEDGTWAAATGNAGGGTVAITTSEHSAIANGLDHTYWVRAFSDPDGTRGNADDVLGAATSITAAPWPVIEAAAAPTTIWEKDNSDEVAEQVDTTRLTVSLTSGQAVYSSMRVRVGVVENATQAGDEADLVSLAATEVTINAGATSASVLITAVDNMTDAEGNPTVAFFADIVEAEGAARDSVEAAAVTITDDDVAPTAPTTPATTQVGSTDTYELTWTFTVDQWGTGAEASRKFQYRVKNAAFTATAADDALWTDVAGGASARLTTVTLAEPSTGTVTYNIEVRAVTDAGNGAALAHTQDRTAS